MKPAHLIEQEENGQAKLEYLRGKCHIMAIALSRLLGWPMAALLNSDNVENPTIMHVLVEDPDSGEYFDVEGFSDEEQLIDSYIFDEDKVDGDPGMLGMVFETQIQGWAGQWPQYPLDPYTEVDIAAATELAMQVIRDHGLEDLVQDTSKESSS